MYIYVGSLPAACTFLPNNPPAEIQSSYFADYILLHFWCDSLCNHATAGKIIFTSNLHRQFGVPRTTHSIQFILIVMLNEKLRFYWCGTHKNRTTYVISYTMYTFQMPLTTNSIFPTRLRFFGGSLPFWSACFSISTIPREFTFVIVIES